MLHRLGSLLLAAAIFASPAWAKPPFEAFGKEANIRDLEISADGKRVAFLQRVEDKDFLMVSDLDGGKTQALARVDELRARDVRWVGNDYVVLIASRTETEFGYRGRFEQSGGFAVSLKTRKITQLLQKTPNIYPAQSGLGRIFGVDPDGEHVYMPAYIGVEQPTFDLLRVNLESGVGRTTGGKDGLQSTRDWIVNARAEVVAREDFSEKSGDYTIMAATGNRFRPIYRDTSGRPGISLLGTSARTGNLVVSAQAEEGDTAYTALHEMSLEDGKIGERIFSRADSDVETIITGENRVIHGVQYAGMFPSYEMFDPELNMDIKVAAAKFPDAAVWLTSWSEDWSRLVFSVEGDGEGPRYVMFDRKSRAISLLARTRPDIEPQYVAQLNTVEFKARDGLKIPALLTWPVGVPADQRKNLPMVMLPHGGPEAYDNVRYDWLAQFLANEGYVVLQPNFRGSDGFGAAFRDAGRGEWGGKMQDDISDGVAAMVRTGWVDPNRVCILGWSYGGYAALAGGALTPDLYKCVVAIAGVSDLRDMLNRSRSLYGARSLNYRYWRRHIGDPDTDREKIDAASPARNVEGYKAPVLLVHGTDDTVVPSTQSDRMESALKRANKAVTYLRIKGDDHSLVDNESRRRVLQEVSAFLAANIGGPPAAVSAPAPAPAATPAQ
jgi:dipeptidyl aminopeptidase/acylaminoacyl peptidase